MIIMHFLELSSNFNSFVRFLSLLMIFYHSYTEIVDSVVQKCPGKLFWTINFRVLHSINLILLPNPFLRIFFVSIVRQKQKDAVVQYLSPIISVEGREWGDWSSRRKSIFRVVSVISLSVKNTP